MVEEESACWPLYYSVLSDKHWITLVHIVIMYGGNESVLARDCKLYTKNGHSRQWGHQTEAAAIYTHDLPQPIEK